MIDGVRGVGTPDVANGDTLSSTLVSGLDQAESTFQQARSKVDSLPTSSRSVFSHAAAALGSSVNGQASAIGRVFSGLRSPELDRAFNEAPACQSSATPSA
jgi:phage-related protein